MICTQQFLTGGNDWSCSHERSNETLTECLSLLHLGHLTFSWSWPNVLGQLAALRVYFINFLRLTFSDPLRPTQPPGGGAADGQLIDWCSFVVIFWCTGLRENQMLISNHCSVPLTHPKCPFHIGRVAWALRSACCGSVLLIYYNYYFLFILPNVLTSTLIYLFLTFPPQRVCSK